jgi:capsular polysaccharide biosynthesis protein
MELKSYVEGNLRRWWIVAITVVLAFIIGGIIANSLPSQYVASSMVLSNGQILSSSVPSSKVNLRTSLDYSLLTSQPTLQYISKHYPRLSVGTLLKDISVSSDADSQSVLISVTDIKPGSAVDIANYLAHILVQDDTAILQREVTYYQNYYSQKVQQLTNDINNLNTTIQKLTPAPTRHPTPLTEAQHTTLNNDQYQLNSDENDLYNDQKALQDVNNISALLPNAYVIMQPATTSTTPLVTPLSSTEVKAIALLIGLFLGICINIIIDYVTPFVRNKGELERITEFSIVGELPELSRHEQKQLLSSHTIFFKRKVQYLRMLSARIMAQAINKQSLTVVITSLTRKRSFTAILGMFLARSGCRTLLIDAHFRDPDTASASVPLSGPSNLTTQSGIPLTFIAATSHPNLFVLPASAMLAQDIPITATALLQLLPELKQLFKVILIEAPSIQASDANLLSTHADLTYLLIRKRRDRLEKLKQAYVLYSSLRLHTTQGLFIS